MEGDDVRAAEEVGACISSMSKRLGCGQAAWSGMAAGPARFTMVLCWALVVERAASCGCAKTAASTSQVLPSTASVKV